MLSDPEVTWGSIYLLNIPKDCKELSAMKPIFSATDQKDIGEHSLGDGCVRARERERQCWFPFDPQPAEFTWNLISLKERGNQNLPQRVGQPKLEEPKSP